MGCDIHLAVEQQDDAGNWHRVFPPTPILMADEFYNANLNPIPLTEFYANVKSQHLANDEWIKRIVFEEWYHDQSYWLFGLLAGVAGVRDHDVEPIACARGIPKDVSWDLHPDNHKWNEYGDTVSGVYLGNHSFSWLTVQELLDHDWSQLKNGYSHAEHAGSFYKITLPALIKLDQPNRTRIVFGFDS